MKELSIDETRVLVERVTKTFGQSGGAKHLNKIGYMSREGKEIKQGHISRILNGSPTQFLSPEVKEEPVPSLQPPVSPAKPLESLEGTPALTRRPGYQEQSPSPLPLVAKVYQEPVAVPLEETEREEALRELHAKNRAALRQELQDEEEARKLKESELPGLVPAPSDHARAEHAHPQELARPHAVFDRRKPVEIKTDGEGNEECFFGIPRLHHKPPVTKSRAYEPKSYGGLVLSTKDLNVRERKRS